MTNSIVEFFKLKESLVTEMQYVVDVISRLDVNYNIVKDGICTIENFRDVWKDGDTLVLSYHYVDPYESDMDTESEVVLKLDWLSMSYDQLQEVIVEELSLLENKEFNSDKLSHLGQLNFTKMWIENYCNHPDKDALLERMSLLMEDITLVTSLHGSF